MPAPRRLPEGLRPTPFSIFQAVAAFALTTAANLLFYLLCIKAYLWVRGAWHIFGG